MSTREPAAPQSALALWWGRFFKAFVGIGALAGVITAVFAAVTAIHPADQEEYAQFREAAVQADMPYSEYHQYLVPPAPVSKSLGARVLVAATPSPSTSDPVAPSATTTSSTPSPDSQKPSTSPRQPKIARPEVAYPGSMRLAPAAESTATTGPCGSDAGCVLRSINPTNDDGTPMAPAKKAEVVRQVVKGSRTTWVKKTRKREMVGAVINVNVELIGLRGKRVLLSWQFWRGDGHTQVYGNWLNDNYAYEIIPGSNHDSAALNFWIPMPKKKGPYFIRTKLTKDGQPLATIDSKPIA